jgi:hypothetical protein
MRFDHRFCELARLGPRETDWFSTISKRTSGVKSSLLVNVQVVFNGVHYYKFKKGCY